MAGSMSPFANAGIIGDMGGIFEIDPATMAETLRVNLIGPALMVKHAGKAMVDQGRGGAIVLTASVAGLNSGAGPLTYSASKAGVINLAKTAAQQLTTRACASTRSAPASPKPE
jgi:NAD(P)-dependent dehydrogenase (short-subunit alcohol dehydrogenase family)